MSKRPGPLVRSLLTDFENDVMKAVWDLGPCSVDAVHQVVSRNRDLKESTTRTILGRLEQKGYLRHETEGRAYIYRAVEPASSLAARAVRQIIDRFCEGSAADLVSGMVDSGALNKKDLDQLEELIHRRQQNARAAKS